MRDLIPRESRERRLELIMAIALRHPTTARWPAGNARGRERQATPLGGLHPRKPAPPPDRPDPR